MGEIATSVLPTFLMLISCYEALAPKQLQGTWEVASETWSGYQMPDKLRVTDVVVKGNAITQQSKLNSDKATFRIRYQYGNPDAIDLIDAEGFFLGICKVDKDELKICYAIKRSDDRPTTFVSDKDSRTVLLVMKRKKTP